MISKVVRRCRWPWRLLWVVRAASAGSTFTAGTALMPMQPATLERGKPDGCLPSHEQLAARRRCQELHLSAWTETGNWTG